MSGFEELVFDISTCGVTSGLYKDEFNPGFLGAQDVRRRSDIVMHRPSQTWGVWLILEDDSRVEVPHLQGYRTYADAVDAEVAWLNACRKAGVQPERSITTSGVQGVLYV